MIRAAWYYIFLMKMVRNGSRRASSVRLMGTMGRDCSHERWSDWSSMPLGQGARRQSDDPNRERGGRRREGAQFVVCTIDQETGTKVRIREINWWFQHDIPGKKVTTDSRRTDVY